MSLASRIVPRSAHLGAPRGSALRPAGAIPISLTLLLFATACSGGPTAPKAPSESLIVPQDEAPCDPFGFQIDPLRFVSRCDRRPPGTLRATPSADQPISPTPVADPLPLEPAIPDR